MMDLVLIQNKKIQSEYQRRYRENKFQIRRDSGFTRYINFHLTNWREKLTLINIIAILNDFKVYLDEGDSAINQLRYDIVNMLQRDRNKYLHQETIKHFSQIKALREKCIQTNL